MNGVDTLPCSRCVCADAGGGHSNPQRALTTCLDSRITWLGEHRHIRFEKVGAFTLQYAKAVVHPGDFLAFIEHRGHVVDAATSDVH